ncbi:hypothetical protein K1719_006101 [Acacia pycnantha]|nr:hypothetical protein K1719_006101 [Acacia pycnantha]
MIDEASRNASTPYDFGSGNLNMGLAMDPGLVYDMSANDYVNYMCLIGLAFEIPRMSFEFANGARTAESTVYSLSDGFEDF